jgi:DNA repair protein RadA/Sms
VAKTPSGSIFVCASCGCESTRWLGRCPNCLEWNTLREEARTHSGALKNTPKGTPKDTYIQSQALSAIDARNEERIKTGYSEFDIVIGGGLVQGAAILLGGEPGIGKSTLLLQLASAFASLPGQNASSVLYVGAEESANQIAMRAARIARDEKTPDMQILSTGALEDITNAITALSPRLVIIDSIQAVYTSALHASPGSLSQVRECAWMLTEECRARAGTLIVSGHVTKDGTLAGPKILEHLVDTVLYFEGSRDRELRILRSVKNRFGGVNEIAVFTMGEKGLHEIADPGGVFIEGMPKIGSHGPGSILTAALEGNRVLLAEVQALVTPRVSGSIVRTTDGVDANRVQRVRAILESQLGMNLGDQDTFVNVTGGLEINEPAVELAIAAAIYGSARGLCPDSRLIVAGELGLLGDLRRIPQAEKRAAQARKFGMDACILPEANSGEFRRADEGKETSVLFAAPSSSPSMATRDAHVLFAANLRDALAIIFPEN